MRSDVASPINHVDELETSRPMLIQTGLTQTENAQDKSIKLKGALKNSTKNVNESLSPEGKRG